MARLHLTSAGICLGLCALTTAMGSGAGTEGVREFYPVLCQWEGPACRQRWGLLASASVSFGARRGQLSCGSDCGGIQSCGEVMVLFIPCSWEESTINRNLEPEGLWKWLLEQGTIQGEKISGSQNF